MTRETINYIPVIEQTDVIAVYLVESQYLMSGPCYASAIGGTNSMPITPDLFTTAEAAELLGITPVAIRQAIRNGILAVVRIDARTNAVTRDEIERYRAEHLGRRFGHAPDRPPTKGAEYARAYRERKKARQQEETAPHTDEQQQPQD